MATNLNMRRKCVCPKETQSHSCNDIMLMNVLKHTWLTPPTTRRRSLMTIEDVEHRGKAMGASLSHFFFWGWKASTVSRAVGS